MLVTLAVAVVPHVSRDRSSGHGLRLIAPILWRRIEVLSGGEDLGSCPPGQEHRFDQPCRNDSVHSTRCRAACSRLAEVRYGGFEAAVKGVYGCESIPCMCEGARPRLGTPDGVVCDDASTIGLASGK